jgi:type IV pilus assembly protein PilA
MKKEVTKNNKGFSLVELIVVIAIMAVLMAVLAPALLRYVEKSRIQKDESAASEVENAVEIAMSDNDIYEAVNGVAKVEVTYTGADGKIAVTAGDTANQDVLKELETTLKATGTDGDEIGKTASKTYSNATFTVTAEFDSAKSAYIISSEWTGKTE